MIERFRSLAKGLRPSSGSGSFLPEAYVRARTERRANLLGLSLFGIVMLCVVGAFFVTNHRWIAVREQREVIDGLYAQQAERISQLKTLEEQRSEMIERAAVTTSIVELVPRSVVLAVLSRGMPETMTILELDVGSEKVQVKTAAATKEEQDARGVRSISSKSKKKNKGEEEEEAKVEPERFRHTLTVEGVATTNEEIAEYIDRLESSELFETLELSFIKASKLRGLGLRQFQVTAVISEETDARDFFERDEPATPTPAATNRVASFLENLIGSADTRGDAPGDARASFAVEGEDLP